MDKPAPGTKFLCPVVVVDPEMIPKEWLDLDEGRFWVAPDGCEEDPIMFFSATLDELRPMPQEGCSAVLDNQH